jgi:hypothetical protein
MFGPGHIEHCVDYVTRGIICNADLAIEPFGTRSSGPHNIEHECKDIDAIMNWAALHKANSTKDIPGRHPNRA